MSDIVSKYIINKAMEDIVIVANECSRKIKPHESS
jgi:hypothetical protein